MGLWGFYSSEGFRRPFLGLNVWLVLPVPLSSTCVLFLFFFWSLFFYCCLKMLRFSCWELNGDWLDLNQSWKADKLSYLFAKCLRLLKRRCFAYFFRVWSFVIPWVAAETGLDAHFMLSCLISCYLKDFFFFLVGFYWTVVTCVCECADEHSVMC